MSLPLPDDIDLVIFDCDGVLVDSEVICCAALQNLLDSIGIPLGLDEIFDQFLGRDFRTVDAFVTEALGECPPSLRAELRSTILSAFPRELSAIANVSAALDRIPVPTCVASSSDLERVNLALKCAGLSHHFSSRVWTAELVERGKPAPDLFLYAAASMKVAPSRTLVIEDSPSGVKAARSADMRVWGFTGGSHHRYLQVPLVEAGAELLFDDMNQLWPPSVRA